VTDIVLSFQVDRHKKQLLSNNLFSALDCLSRRGLSYLESPGKFHGADAGLPVRPVPLLCATNQPFVEPKKYSWFFKNSPSSSKGHVFPVNATSPAPLHQSFANESSIPPATPAWQPLGYKCSPNETWYPPFPVAMPTPQLIFPSPQGQTVD
jgi:hypothetical protein